MGAKGGRFTPMFYVAAAAAVANNGLANITLAAYPDIGYGYILIQTLRSR